MERAFAEGLVLSTAGGPIAMVLYVALGVLHARPVSLPEIAIECGARGLVRLACSGSVFVLY